MICFGYLTQSSALISSCSVLFIVLDAVVGRNEVFTECVVDDVRVSIELDSSLVSTVGVLLFLVDVIDARSV